MVLSSLNYRVIAVDYPPYWNVDDFCVGFRKLLDNLSLKEVSYLYICIVIGLHTGTVKNTAYLSLLLSKLLKMFHKIPILNQVFIILVFVPVRCSELAEPISATCSMVASVTNRWLLVLI